VHTHTHRPFECAVCFEPKQPDRGDAAVRLDACDHPLCVECFAGLVQNRIAAKGTAKCPHDGCATLVTARDVNNALGAEAANAYADIEQRELMMRLGQSLYKCAFFELALNQAILCQMFLFA
jgi:hypothetical protein